jgi:hypothetical protein
VAERKPYLLRLDPATLAALQRWADDELRSLNGQLEFLLRRALQDAGRAPRGAPPPHGAPGRRRRGPANPGGAARGDGRMSGRRTFRP